MHNLKFTSPNELCTVKIAGKIAERLEKGDIIALSGELGVGKTVFARGIARGLGVPESVPVTSPTFAIINEYEGRLPLYHLDLYRVTVLAELDDLPWREALFGDGVSVIEWAERISELLPDERFDIRIEFLDENSRTITVEAHGEKQIVRLLEWASDLREAFICHQNHNR